MRKPEWESPASAAATALAASPSPARNTSICPAPVFAISALAQLRNDWHENAASTPEIVITARDIPTVVWYARARYASTPICVSIDAPNSLLISSTGGSGADGYIQLP